MRLCSISVDLDEIPHYHAIHGLPEPKDASAHAVYDVALSRLHGWADSLGFSLTLFAIGRDMARAESAKGLKRMAEHGHEIANHTLDHRYDLVRLSRADIVEQVCDGAAALERATGQTVHGFRAPGYTTSDTLYEVLSEQGYGYSSSVFPCPSYYAAKAGAIGSIRLRGRRSHSILDTPKVLTAPRVPYRVGKPYWQRGDGLLELPIQVTKRLRLPFIGTTLTLLGPKRARWLTGGVLDSDFVNLELHGIDVLSREDGLHRLAPFQPDVRVPLDKKIRALSATVETLQEAGFRMVRLDEAARALSERAGESEAMRDGT